MNLEAFKNELAKQVFGMTPADAHAKRVCIRCKNVPVTTTDAAIAEYKISALCEKCFAEIGT
jgi:hypothetical protein